MASKYIKFGLRSDRNLADLENPAEALGNLLNNISTQVDENGSPTGFNTSDLSPIVGLRNTGLADNVTIDGTSIDLSSLNNSLVEYTPLASPTTTLEVQPRITIQDNINNFKSVLVDPPWINGGDGPITKFIPASRINATINASTKGNSGTGTYNTNTKRVTGLGSNLYSTLANANLFTIVEGEDFWNNGVFQLGSKIHPTFSNTYGMIQWTGYLSSSFTQEWESTGLFMIEQDIIDDGTNNNWTTLKSVYSTSYTTASAFWSNDGTTTTTTIFIAPSEIKHVCKGMKVTISSNTYTLTSVNELNGTCTFLGALNNITPTPLTFTWSLSDDLIRTGSLKFQEPRTGGRTRVRYTVWWPNPSDVSLLPNTTYRTKRFAYAIENSDRLPFSMIYSTYNKDQSFGQYTYEYFKRNRASVLKQDSTYPLRVNATTSMNYIPPSDLSDVVKGMTAGATIVTAKVFNLMDSFGRIEGVAGAFTGCEVGDWLAFNISTNYYAYQIEEIRSDTVAYISKDVLATTGVSRLTTVSNGVVFKNTGIIGIFRLSSTGGTQGSLYPVSGTTIPLSDIYPDYIAMGITTGGALGFKPLRITTASGTNPRAVTTSNYLSNGSTLPATTTHICAVYSTRGLEDLSSVAQCTGVYGREVNVTAAPATTAITLTTNAGVTAGAVGVGDYVQFAGAGGTADPVIADGTYVVSLTGSTIVNLSAGVRTGKTLNKASTLIFVKAANRVAGANKEYCVIPLNTAPPFEGTDLGLVTPASNPNLIVKNFKFGQLDLTIPDAKVQVATGISSASLYFPIIYNGVTYRALVA